MVKMESDCVACGLPCLYESCPHYMVEKHYCDRCDSHAVAEIDGEDFCEKHAENLLNDLFHGLLIAEKCELLEVDYRKE